MSLDASRWAWQQQNLKASEKLVLLAIADRAGENHTAHPSIKRLELDTCLNRKTIIRSLDHLELIGLLLPTGEKVGRTRQVKVYQLSMVPERHALEPSSKQSQKRNSPKSGTVPLLPSNSPKNGTPEQSQKRYSEPTSIEPISEPYEISAARMQKKMPPDFKGVVNAYNEILGDDLPRVVKITKAREKSIRARWQETFGSQSKGNDLNFWRRYFLHVRKSKVLCGLKENTDWKGADFDWLMNEQNMAKVIEGKYHREGDWRTDIDLQEAV
ncbi:helix-turn-helix domain-containing protein [Marinobacter nauticus]|uniref:helix-turn-helix domain-containing protein n=1 Tax=Marinobacter nauticus TaxID=2743 RepID=UPI001C9A10E4|nr:helix-turn-helix domain-containing protein [Marinobacter nauticus]MBY5961920.1 helix-turn-helix domain-containing protein [Marinobacter nauticus]